MKTKKILFFSLLLLFFRTWTSSQIITGDIYYSHLSGYSYQINVELYTSLPGIDTAILLNTSDSTIYLSGSSQSFDNFALITFTTPHTYTALGSYYISVNVPNRIPDIINMANSHDTEFYLQCKLIIDSSSINNSPTKTTLPIDTATIGNIYQYNLNITDSDNDTLLYYLIPPAGTGAFIPVGLTIDSLYGTITWDTPYYVGQYIIDILIKEKRNGITVGESIKELCIIATDANSISPQPQIPNPQSLISVFPNPATQSISIKADNIAHITLYDVSGQIISSTEYGVKESPANLDLELNNLSVGIYFLKIQNDKQNKIVKVVKF